MRHTLIEAAYLLAGLLAVAAITAAAAWAYPLGRTPITWTGRVAAVIVLLWNVPQLRAAWARDRSRG